jgi:ribose transport system permease protein
MNTSTNHPASTAARRPLRLLRGALGPSFGLLLVIGFFTAADVWRARREATRLERPVTATFFTLRNLQATSVQASTVAVAALGMTVIIIAGGIDLSAGTALALSATVLAWCLRAGHGALLSVLAGVGTGCLTGLINGLLISRLRVVPFIITLGTMTAYLGAAKLVAEEITVRPALDQVPHWLSQSGLVTSRPKPAWLVEPILPNFSDGIWAAAALAAGLAAVLRYSVFGRHVFAVGSNEATARLCGVNVPLVKVAVYALGGAFVGVAGLYQFARLGEGNPSSGTGMELRIIAAVVIGGGSLSGGRGSVLGTLAGAAMMATIASGCNQLGLSNPLQDIIVGVIIVAAVTLDVVRGEA